MCQIISVYHVTLFKDVPILNMHLCGLTGWSSTEAPYIFMIDGGCDFDNSIWKVFSPCSTPLLVRVLIWLQTSWVTLDSDAQPTAPKQLFHTMLVKMEFIMSECKDFICILFCFKGQQNICRTNFFRSDGTHLSTQSDIKVLTDF